MMVETWHASERDTKRAEAHFATKEGQKLRQRVRGMICRAREWRIAHEGYKPTPEELKELEEWRKNRDK